MRSRLREIAEETVRICGQGSYDTPAGRVQIGAAIAASVADTRLHLPDEPIEVPAPRDEPPHIEVTNESTLAAARRLADGDVACLVFASARNPGGGFVNGAQAQEESIARSCALYPSQQAAFDFYATHRANPDLAYSDRVIHSPAVPVFRDDDATLLPRPYQVAFLTCAAPNLAAIQRNQPDRAAAVPSILARRAERVLRVAAAHGHRRLVLGAWGCGVFGNEPKAVADVFATALRANPYFEQIVFAVLDRGRATPTFDAFAAVFGTGR